MKKSIIAISAIAITVASSAFAGGHTGNPAVSARQAHMGLYQFHAGYLGGIAQGKVEYDAALAQGAADALVALVQIDQRRYWTPGTDNFSIDGTRAKPELWENFPNVIKISGDLVAGAMAVQAAAGNGKDAIGAAIGGVFGACSACHKAYRAPQN